MELKIVLDFLNDLKLNNNREWFNGHKNIYKEARNTFEQLVELIIAGIQTFDGEISGNEAKDCIFRINRDVRFSKNKDPYKTNFGALIAKGGNKSQYAGYYIHMEPDGSFIGGGIYMPESAILKAIRSEILSNPEELINIISSKEFKSVFPAIYGERLKSSPQGFPKEFKYMDLLRNKHYAVAHKVENEFWSDPNVVKNITEIFHIQLPFNQFLNKVIDSM